jgi:hypothetical protein
MIGDPLSLHGEWAGSGATPAFLRAEPGFAFGDREFREKQPAPGEAVRLRTGSGDARKRVPRISEKTVTQILTRATPRARSPRRRYHCDTAEVGTSLRLQQRVIVPIKVLEPHRYAPKQPKVNIEVIYGDDKGHFGVYARGAP